MKNKKIVYFEDDLEDKGNMATEQSTTRKNVSTSKATRESSVNKIQKYMLNAPRFSGEKMGGAQKIKILLRKEGFIFEKKYLIFDISCTLIRKTYGKKQVLVDQKEASEGLKQDPNICQQVQDFLCLNLQPNSFGITKGLVRHSFPIEKDGGSFVEVRAGDDYILQNAMIHNKRIQFVQLNGTENIDDQDLTIIQPMKMIEESQFVRSTKIKSYFESKLQGRTKKDLSFCWNLGSNAQKSQSIMKSPAKKSEPQWSAIFHNATNTVNMSNSTIMRGRSSTKGNTSIQDSFYGDLNKARRDTTPKNTQKMGFFELMKAKETKGLCKASSKKLLNESNRSFAGGTKRVGKENGKKQKEDVYGLQEMQNKKSRVKKTFDPAEAFEAETYGMAKKIH